MKKFLVALLSFAILFSSADAKKKAKRRAHRASKKVVKVDGAARANESFIVIDCATGEILTQLRADERCAPSSMTKLMTLYLLFEAIRDGRVHLSDEYLVSELAQHQEGSRSFFKAGTSAVVEDLIRSIIVHSGNDASVIVAEGLCGDVSVFVDQMNKKAQQFGLTNTHFVNPMGLPNADHYSTVGDLAKIARRIILDFPQFYHYFSEKVFTINGITQHNRNTMLGNSLRVDGLKTGHTSAGGYGIVVSADQNGTRLIVVVNGYRDNTGRTQSANRLLAMGFQEFNSIKVAEAGRAVTSAKVSCGDKDEISLCTHQNVALLVNKRDNDSVKVEAVIKEPIEAPIAGGAKVGKLVCKYGNKQFSYDLYACSPVTRLGFFDLAVKRIRKLIFGDEQGRSTSLNMPLKKQTAQ